MGLHLSNLFTIYSHGIMGSMHI